MDLLVTRILKQHANSPAAGNTAAKTTAKKNIIKKNLHIFKCCLLVFEGGLSQKLIVCLGPMWKSLGTPDPA